jgi:hypothetical protein
MTIDPADYLESVDSYKREGRLLDDTLYQLCYEHPGHTDPGVVNAKLWLIGRGFATGVERHIPSTGKQGSSLGKMTVHLLRNAYAVDQIVRRLRQLHEPLDTGKLQVVITQHGKFCRIASRIARSKLVSFASKYLHFHAPIVPIFDRWAYGQVWRMRQRDNSVPFKLPTGGNNSFYWYCLAFWQVYESLRDLRQSPNVRLVESYLMWLASR